MLLMMMWIALYLPSRQSVPVPGSPTAVSDEEVALYRRFLKDYRIESKQKLNIASVAEAFSPGKDERETCFKGLEFDPAGAHAEMLDERVVNGYKARLVDAGKQMAEVKANDPELVMRYGASSYYAVTNAYTHALVSLSQVRFDKTDNFAAFTYGIRCGSLCGSGGIAIYERTSAGWQESTRPCGIWMS
jgi:hypothetical protein